MDSIPCSAVLRGSADGRGRRIGFGTRRSSVGLWSFPWTLVTTSPHSFCRIPPHRVSGDGPVGRQGGRQREGDRLWLELEGARQGLARGALCALHSGLTVGTPSDRKEVPFCQPLGTTRCQEVDVPCLLFFHLLQFHDAWELRGSLRGRPPPTSELPAVPQDGAEVSTHPTPGLGTSRASWSPLSRDIVGRLDVVLGVAFPPASPSWLLPEAPA